MNRIKIFLLLGFASFANGSANNLAENAAQCKALARHHKHPMQWVNGRCVNVYGLSPACRSGDCVLNHSENPFKKAK